LIRANIQSNGIARYKAGAEKMTEKPPAERTESKKSILWLEQFSSSQENFLLHVELSCDSS
jgi:hypothetical protein